MLDVFPWVRHLNDEEKQQCVRDLAEAAHDATDPDVHAALHRVIVKWRATARILADPALTAQLTRELPGEDHGEAFAP